MAATIQSTEVHYNYTYYIVYVVIITIHTLDIPTQDPVLMKEVRTFESEGLKSVPQQRKNLNPVSGSYNCITHAIPYHKASIMASDV